MKQRILIILLSFGVILPSISAFSQSLKDSLWIVVSTSRNDSVKADAYNDLIWEYMGVNNDSALIVAKKGIEIAEKIGYKKGLANAHRYIGLVYERVSNYAKALYHQKVSLQLCEELNFKPGIANTLNNIAVIYQHLGDYKKALEYQEKSLKLCEETDQKEGIAACLGNIGNIYNSVGAKEKALQNYLKALKMYEELGNEHGIAVSMGNIGNLYKDKANYELAEEFLLKSLKTHEKTGNTQGMAIAMQSAGDCYFKLGDYEKALQYFTNSVKLAAETGAINTERDSYYGMYQIYKKRNNTSLALKYHEEFVRLNDSLTVQEKNEDINTVKMQFELEKQEAELKQKAKAEQEKILAIAEEKERAQRLETEIADQKKLTIIYISIGGLILVAVFSAFLFSRFQITKRQKNIIERQKQEVDEKHKQITDSINYAQRIQAAILPSESDVQKLLSESFVYFHPRDIVSGDFYWINETNGSVILAVGDCTGHGVPGGFMSMLGNSFLNEIIIEKNITEPAQILNSLREKIMSALKQTGSNAESKDGMDIVLCRLDKNTLLLTYAAANNDFYLVRQNMLTEMKADKMPIGYQSDVYTSFVQHEVRLQKNDSVYLFTDGYADQFGGPSGKKFKYQQLEKLLSEISTLSTDLQKEKLENAFVEWKTNYEQVDDVCVIGIKI